MKRYTILIGAAAAMLAAAGSASVFLASAAAGPGPAMGFGFIASRGQPTAGHLFRAVVVVNRDPARVRLRKVRCDAEIGHERLHGRQHRYFVPPYTAPADIACSWQIPADAGGRKLQLWRYGFGRRVGVFDGAGFAADSRPFSWRVKP